MFGRGYRTDLDENDPETQQLVQRMRLEIAREFSRGELESGYCKDDADDDGTKTEDINDPPFQMTSTDEGRALKRKASPRSSSALPHDSTNVSMDNLNHNSPVSEEAIPSVPRAGASKPSDGLIQYGETHPSRKGRITATTTHAEKEPEPARESKKVLHYDKPPPPSLEVGRGERQKNEINEQKSEQMKNLDFQTAATGEKVRAGERQNSSEGGKERERGDVSVSKKGELNRRPGKGRL